jgi:hypothetical protein
VIHVRLLVAERVGFVHLRGCAATADLIVSAEPSTIARLNCERAAVDGGESGIRTLPALVDSVTCRFHIAAVAVNASDAGAACRSCPRPSPPDPAIGSSRVVRPPTDQQAVAMFYEDETGEPHFHEWEPNGGVASRCRRCPSGGLRRSATWRMAPIRNTVCGEPP